ERVRVHGGDRPVPRDHTRDDHHGGPDDRDARPIHPEPWQAADPEPHIGADEDSEGDQPVELGPVHARNAASAPPGAFPSSMRRDDTPPASDGYGSEKHPRPIRRADPRTRPASTREASLGVPASTGD